MTKIKILPHEELCPDGIIIENVSEGISICDILLENQIDIEHACEKSCACTTCHVHVRKGFRSITEASELEEDLLDQAWGVDLDSRLSCQSKVGKEDLTIEIPRYSINHAKENH